ncbi:uncharacterized protein V1516DRAFT_656016 [Lipomyces oligophaga]|uniref:uncharacterized protein n=1 Tax=Lipomyces oligophaga TaxID=45792 RepID=UPI0034CFBA40
MASNLDKSLDEIISQSNVKRPRSRNKARLSGQQAGVRKSVPKPGRGQSQPAKASLPPVRLEANDKVIISNLPTDVKEDSIKEYFSTAVGPIKKCSITYNAKGQSTGTATIIFHRPGDASATLNQFNGVAVDGKKIMHVELVVDPNKRTLADRIQPPASKSVVAPTKAARTKAKAAVASAKGNKNTAANTNARGPRKNGGKARRPKKTVEQLDAEMADYFVGGANTSGTAPTPAAVAPAAAVPIGDIPM